MAEAVLLKEVSEPVSRFGVPLATQLAMLPQPPRLVFTTGDANRATDAFRLEAVDCLLKTAGPGTGP
jgi:DNA-binding LytR/AlgR family response regulator